MTQRGESVRMTPRELQVRGAELLHAEWKRVLDETSASHSQVDLPDDVVQNVKKLINSPTKSYRYVPITQVLAKGVNPSLDARFLQKEFSGPGAFDARSLCHKVIVPFDRENDGVLGGSPEPYVNNPLREPSATLDTIANKRDTEGWKAICEFLEWVESNPSAAGQLLHLCLHAIKERMTAVKITYPIPNRISLDASIGLLEGFLRDRTGGARLQAVSVALFETWRRRSRAFRKIKHAKVTAADASTGQVADIECLASDGSIVLAIEVKDRRLRIQHIEEKLPALREAKVQEVLFLAGQSAANGDRENIAQRTASEFAAGMNIYTFECIPFARVLLAMFGEPGRRAFLEGVGRVLDAEGSVRDRQAWRDALGEQRPV